MHACMHAFLRACVLASNEVVTFTLYWALVGKKRYFAAQIFDPLDSGKIKSTENFQVHLGNALHLLKGSVVGTYLVPLNVIYSTFISSGGLN